jgi:hypothetical protein
MKLVVLFGEGWFLRRNIYLVRGTFFFAKILTQEECYQNPEGGSKSLSQPIMDSRSGAGCELPIGVWGRAHPTKIW